MQEVEMVCDPKVWQVAENLVAQHEDEALQIAFDEARERAARSDNDYKVWLKVADRVGVLLD